MLLSHMVTIQSLIPTQRARFPKPAPQLPFLTFRVLPVYLALLHTYPVDRLNPGPLSREYSDGSMSIPVDATSYHDYPGCKTGSSRPTRSARSGQEMLNDIRFEGNPLY